MSTADAAEHEALLQFLYLAPIGLVQADLDGEILMVNPLCAQLLMPVSRNGELSNLFVLLEPLAPDLRHRVNAFTGSHGTIVDALQLQADAGQPAEGYAGTGEPEDGTGRDGTGRDRTAREGMPAERTRRVAQPARPRPRMLSLSLLKLDEGRLMAVVSDVTASVERERELRESRAWIDSIINGVADYALMSLDERGLVRSWNAGIDRVTGFDADETIGRSYALFYPSGGISTVQALDRLQEADRSGWSLDEGWRRRRDGSLFWGSCLIAPLNAAAALPEAALPAHAPTRLPGVEGAAYSLIIRDISSDREARDALRRAVHCDHLTGLSNRRAFFEAAQVELQRYRAAPQSLSLVMIDADRFKALNEAHGHAGGDAVLRHLAAGLETTFRTRDVKARIGGEEFVVLLPGATTDEALALAGRFCSSIAAAHAEVDGVSIRYTVSAGVASMDAAADGIDALLKRADAALYRAKAGGRNRAESWHADLVRAVELPT